MYDSNQIYNQGVSANSERPNYHLQSFSENTTDPSTPTLIPRINHNSIRKWIYLIGRDRRDMISVAIDNINNLDRISLQRTLHSTSSFGCLALTSRTRERHVEYPSLPDQVLVCFPAVPVLASLAFGELEKDLASATG